MRSRLTRRRLQAMHDRWTRDLAVLEAAFPSIDLKVDFGPEAETIRNLATAIAEVRAVIVNVLPLTDAHRSEAGRAALKMEGRDG